MEQIEDQAHSLFSSLVRASYSGKTLSFEGEDFPMGIGPKVLKPDGKIHYDLSGRCGLLGHGHPLLIKSYIKATLRGQVFAESKEIENFLEEFRDFTNSLGFSCDWNISTGNSEPNLFSGRFKFFFQDGKPSSISSVFPFELNPVKGPTPSQISYSNLILAKDTLRFLRDGNFFGENGLISIKEKQLKERFHAPWVDRIEGLCVHLKESHSIKSNEILSQSSCLIFPLSFDEFILDEVFTQVGP